jgi:hypothetical protein
MKTDSASVREKLSWEILLNCERNIDIVMQNGADFVRGWSF